MHFFPTILEAAKTVWVTSLRRTLASYNRIPNALVAISKGTPVVKLLQRNPPVLNCGCQLTSLLAVKRLRGYVRVSQSSWFEAGRRQVRSQIPLCYLVRTSSEPTSVMEFGFHIARQHSSCTARYSDTDCSQHSVVVVSSNLICIAPECQRLQRRWRTESALTLFDRRNNGIQTVCSGFLLKDTTRHGGTNPGKEAEAYQITKLDSTADAEYVANLVDVDMWL